MVQGRFVVLQRLSTTGPATPKHAFVISFVFIAASLKKVCTSSVNSW